MVQQEGSWVAKLPSCGFYPGGEVQPYWGARPGRDFVFNELSIQYLFLSWRDTFTLTNVLNSKVAVGFRQVFKLSFDSSSN